MLLFLGSGTNKNLAGSLNRLCSTWKLILDDLRQLVRFNYTIFNSYEIINVVSRGRTYFKEEFGSRT
jgi:hypothetical protein